MSQQQFRSSVTPEGVSISMYDFPTAAWKIDCASRLPTPDMLNFCQKKKKKKFKKKKKKKTKKYIKYIK